MGSLKKGAVSRMGVGADDGRSRRGGCKDEPPLDGNSKAVSGTTPALGGSLRRIEGICNYCGEVCDNECDELNGIACSLEGSPNPGTYHKICVETYLRSIRLDKQRKAGFPCPPGCGKATKYEKPCPGALVVFADLLDSLIVDVATEVHRAARLGLNCFPCEGWAGCEDQNNGEVHYEQEEEQGAKGSLTVEASISSGNPDQTSLPQAQQQQAPQSAGTSAGKQMAAVVDVFGQTHPAVASELFECLNCGRQVGAGRYAPHLEKCMGKGRISSRVASRIINSTQRRSRTSAAGAVASSGSGGSGTGAPRAAPSGACSSSPAIAVLAVTMPSALGTPLSVGSGGAAAMTTFHSVGGSQPSATVSAARMAVGRNPNQTREGSPGSGGIDSVDDADTLISKQDRKKDAQSRGRPSKSRSGKITAAAGGTQKVNRLVSTVSDAREKPKQAPSLNLGAPLLAESTVCANKTNAASSIEEKAGVDTSRENSRYLRTDERVGNGRWAGESDVSVWLGGASPSLEADLDDVPLGSSPMLKRRRKTKSTLLRTVSLAAIDTGKRGVAAKSNGAVYSASVASIGDGSSVNLCIDTLDGRHAGPQGHEEGRSFAESRIVTDGRTAHVAEAPSSTGNSHNTGLTEACLQNGNETRAHPEGIGNSNTAVPLWQRAPGPVGERAAVSPFSGIDPTRLKERVGREPQHAVRRKAALVLHDGEEVQAKGREMGRSGYSRSLTAYGSVSVTGVDGVDGVKETSKEERGIQIPSRKARSVEYAGEVEGVDDVIKVKKRRQRPSTKSRQSVKLGPQGRVGGAQLGTGWVME